MYLEHYGLRELPFSLTPDTSFFFGYGHYRDAYNTLVVALQNGEGFIKVTGEVGTGKTLLCRKLLNSLDDDYATAYIPNPYLSPSALILAVADELAVEVNAKEGPHRALKQISERLVELTTEGKKVVLCIDEAQAMPEQTLETLRLITNLETEKRKLLHVVLFGQPELDERLNQPAARQLRQRITFSYTLQPIDAEGIAAYLQHRLLVAGGNGEVGFDGGAVKQLFQGSGGFPRLINILAHKALMLGYGQGIKQIDASQVKAAISDTEGAVTRQPKSTRRTVPSHAVSVVLGLALVGMIAYHFLPPAPGEAAVVPAVAVPPQAPHVATPNANTTVTAEPIIPAAATPRLSSITPAQISGSWVPQQLLVHGEALPEDTNLIVSWAGREKLLAADRVEWLDANTLRITLTTGVRDEFWRVQLVHSDGQRSEAVGFTVIAPNL